MECKKVEVQRLVLTPSEIEILQQANGILDDIINVMTKDGWELLVDVDEEASVSINELVKMQVKFDFLTQKLRFFDLKKDEVF